MNERPPIRFAKFAPTVRDYHVGYSYVIPATGRKRSPGTDRWMRAKMHIAEAAMWTGAEEFVVWGGMGKKTWRRTVLVSQDEAEAFLREAAARNFTNKGSLRRALTAQARRNPPVG